MSLLAVMFILNDKLFLLNWMEKFVKEDICYTFYTFCRKKEQLNNNIVAPYVSTHVDCLPTQSAVFISKLHCY
jgi:hypothetical protein